MTTARAIVFEQPEQLSLRSVPISDSGPGDVVVEIDYSGISTGTERLLWSGKMPPFPGMGYPLIPGYESVGRIVAVGDESGRNVGETVFVPGARCYGDIKGLFGGSASRVVVPGSSAVAISPDLGEQGVLIALAATAHHALAGSDGQAPELIVGHGVLGRLLARVAIARGAPAPVVWETDKGRMDGAQDYSVVHPDDDDRRDYAAIHDVSGDSHILDTLIARLAPAGEIVLAGFYADALSFAFPPAFMREARMRIAAQWAPDDLTAVVDMIADGRLNLDGLITHHNSPADAADAYDAAFSDPSCLKMVLDWRDV